MNIFCKYIDLSASLAEFFFLDIFLPTLFQYVLVEV